MRGLGSIRGRGRGNKKGHIRLAKRKILMTKPRIHFLENDGDEPPNKMAKTEANKDILELQVPLEGGVVESQVKSPQPPLQSSPIAEPQLELELELEPEMRLCEECGKFSDIKEFGESVTGHVFSAANLCRDCGNFSSHRGGIAESSYEEENLIESEDLASSSSSSSFTSVSASSSDTTSGPSYSPIKSMGSPSPQKDEILLTPATAQEEEKKQDNLGKIDPTQPIPEDPETWEKGELEMGKSELDEGLSGQLKLLESSLTSAKLLAASLTSADLSQGLPALQNLTQQFLDLFMELDETELKLKGVEVDKPKVVEESLKIEDCTIYFLKLLALNYFLRERAFEGWSKNLMFYHIRITGILNYYIQKGAGGERDATNILVCIQKVLEEHNNNKANRLKVDIPMEDILAVWNNIRDFSDKREVDKNGVLRDQSRLGFNGFSNRIDLIVCKVREKLYREKKRELPQIEGGVVKYSFGYDMLMLEQIQSISGENLVDPGLEGK